MIARRSLLIVLNKAVGTAVGFAGLFFVFRFFSKDAYGMYAFSFALIGLFALINGLGVNAAHVKRVSQGHHEDSANGTFLVIKLMLATLFVAVCAAAFAVWTVLLGQGFTQATTPKLLAVMAVAYTTLALRQYFDFSFRAHRQIAVGEAVLFIDSLVTALGFFTVAQVWRHLQAGWVPFPGWAEFWSRRLGLTGPLSLEDGAVLLAAAFFLGTVASLLMAAAVFLVHRYPVGPPDRATLATYVQFAWPVALVSVMTVLYTNLDTVFLGFFWFVQDTADYRAAAKLLTPALVFGHALWTLLFPTISHHHAQAEPGAIARLVRRAERYLAMVLLGVLTLAIVFTEEGLRLVSSEAYLSAAPTLRILTLYVFFSSLLLPAKAVLLGSDMPRTLLRVGLATTAVAVLLNLVLVPSSILGVPLAGLRAPGAALGTGIALAVAYVYVKALARRHAQIPWWPQGIGRQLTAAAATGILLTGVKILLGPGRLQRFYELGAVAVLGLLLYAAFLALLRELRRDDWEFIKDVSHPGKMQHYVRQEFRKPRQGS